MMDRASDRLDKRRAALVEAARRLFLEKGYEQTTLADVVTCGGGSLATLYKLFGNKEGLLLAVVREGSESGADIVAEVAAAGLPPAQTLRAIGLRLHDRFMQAANMGLLRVVIARSIENPDFARNFYEMTMLGTASQLEIMFLRWRAQGIAFTGRPEELATTFLGLMIYDFQIATISHCARGVLDDTALDNRIAFFCRGMELADGT